MKQSTIDKIIQFSKERDWDQFHNGKDLALSLVLEASELLELYQWSGTDTECIEQLAKLKEELADVLMYAVLIADHYHLDLDDIVSEKIAQNKQKYPREQSFGRADKYVKLAQEMDKDALTKEATNIMDNRRNEIRNCYFEKHQSIETIAKHFNYEPEIVAYIVQENL